ncbi:hypothetical protein Peur_043549 [Populus x canadensis]
MVSLLAFLRWNLSPRHYINALRLPENYIEELGRNVFYKTGSLKCSDSFEVSVKQSPWFINLSLF